MVNQLRQSAITGKLSPQCQDTSDGPCTDAQYAHGYCYRHQGRRRLKLAAQRSFYESASASAQVATRDIADVLFQDCTCDGANICSACSQQIAAKERTP